LRYDIADKLQVALELFTLEGKLVTSADLYQVRPFQGRKMLMLGIDGKGAEPFHLA
jgi:hypothetical protein